MTELIKRRSTFTGIFNRVTEDGDAAYVLIDYEHPKVMLNEDNEKVTILDTPVVVGARHFGPENITGKVRVTVLVEQVEMTQEDVDLLAEVGIQVIPTSGDRASAPVEKFKPRLVVSPDDNQGEK